MDYSRYKHIKIDKDEKVAIVTINRPEAHNAVDMELHIELENIFSDVARDKEVNVVVLTGAGDKAFSAGGDINSMGSGEFESFENQTGLRNGRRLIHNLLEVEQPIIAAVNGHAIGLGATLALFCDVIIASESAKIGDPHVSVGLVAGDGGAVIWPLLCGLAKAKEYLMTGDLMTAAEAERINLINHVVPQAQVMPKALELAHRLANGPSLAIRFTKLACNKRLRDQVNLVLETSLAVETISLFSKDHKEGVRAFLEKRAPQYKGY